MKRRKIRTSREIGQIVKKRRQELKISQEELSVRLGVTYQQVQRYENGANRLNVENIQVIADSLEVPVAYFFENGKKDVSAKKSAVFLRIDEKELLDSFRKVKGRNYKKTVLQVARLAAKVKA